MSLIKIADAKPPCLNPEHNPPTHMVLGPGVYQHTCPACGYITQFTAGGYNWNTSNPNIFWLYK